MSKNRVGYTIRLNQREQSEMQLMMGFFDKDHKEITKLALAQLFIAVGQISKKATQEDVSLETTSLESGSSESVSVSVSADSSPTTEAE